MGGYMSFQRFRNRNLLGDHRTVRGEMYGRPDPRDGHVPAGSQAWSVVLGDLDRMVNDYVRPETYDGPSYLEDSPLHRAAEETGVDVETLRRVFRYVFEEQR